MASRVWDIIKPSVDAIVFSNIWISLAALSLYLSVKLAFGLPVVLFEGALIFSSSFIGYNLLKLKGLNDEGNSGVFNAWMRKRKFAVYVLMFIAGLGVLYSLSEVNFQQLAVLIVSALMVLVYIGFERFNLRSFWFLKTQIVAFVWATFILGIALANFYTELPLHKLAFLFAGVFFFILGLTIPFDIRDWNADKLNSQLTTLPMLFGLKGTLVIAMLHLLLAFVCLLFFSFHAIILLPILVIGLKLIYSLNTDSSEYYYTFALDGLIVLVYPLLWIASSLF